MNESWLPVLSLLIGFLGLLFTIYHTTSTNKKKQRDQDIEKGKEQQEIVSKLDNLASKAYLDHRLKEEMESLEKGLKTQIDELKSDMKEQINDVKLDIKSQKEATETMGKEIVRATESAQHAHERIKSTDKRIDDLKEMFLLATNKKA